MKKNTRQAVADSTLNTVLLCSLLAIAVPLLGAFMFGSDFRAVLRDLQGIMSVWDGGRQRPFWAAWLCSFLFILPMTWCWNMKKHFPGKPHFRDVYTLILIFVVIGWLSSLIVTGASFKNIMYLTGTQRAAWFALFIPLAVFIGLMSRFFMPGLKSIPLPILSGGGAVVILIFACLSPF